MCPGPAENEASCPSSRGLEAGIVFCHRRKRNFRVSSVRSTKTAPSVNPRIFTMGKVTQPLRAVRPIEFQDCINGRNIFLAKISRVTLGPGIDLRFRDATRTSQEQPARLPKPQSFPGKEDDPPRPMTKPENNMQVCATSLWPSGTTSQAIWLKSFGPWPRLEDRLGTTQAWGNFAF